MSPSDDLPYWDKDDPNSDYYEYERVLSDLEWRYQIWEAMQEEGFSGE